MEIFSIIVDDMSLGVVGLTKNQAEEAGIEVVFRHLEAVNKNYRIMPKA